MKITKRKIFAIYFLNCISLIICAQSYNTFKPGFRCGIKTFKPIEVSLKNAIPINPQNSKRTLDNIDKDGFKDFNICLDLCNFEEEIILYNLQDKRDLFVEGMKKAISTLKTLLRVKPPQFNYKFTDDLIEDIGINKWNKSLIGNETDKGMIDLDIDLFIFVRFDNKENMGELTLASALVEYLESGNGKPLLGLVNINREIDYSKENSLQYFEGTIIHEFTHILGFSNFYFTNFFNNVFTKVDDFGIKRSYINSTKVVEVGKKYFNCDSLEGIALEDFGGEGTVGSHWEARILLGDYMNGEAFTSEEIISEFTLALLEDSGYYKANYYTGGLMQFGKNKGCDFLNKKCIENGKLDPKYSNEFFYNIYSKYQNFDTSCSSDRQSRTYHILFLYNSLQKRYQYYKNPAISGYSSAEYCPVSIEDNDEEKNAYYVGHCSERGSGEYGSRIYYDYNNTSKFHKSGEIKDIIAESHSGNSFCVLSSLISKSKENYEYYSNTIRAVCYQMHCSNRSLTIQINNDFIVCPRAGGKINATNYDGYLSCPDYNLICSGSVLCNDMFDCVEKKSLLKDDIIYDYETKTTQDLEVIKNESFSDDAYELSTNGKCCQYCSQCNELNKCIKCRNNFGIVEFTENAITKRECKSIDELNNGYYKNEENSIYYKCIDNCKECSNDSECITCKEGYSKSTKNNNKCFLSINKCKEYDDFEKCTKCELGYEAFGNGTICKIGIDKCIEVDNNGYCTKCEENFILSNYKCHKKIEKCQVYEVDEKCKKCEEGYTFEENDRLNCKNINEFEEYYTKDNGLSYFKCDGTSEENIKNCKKCNYNNDKLICNECKDNYINKDNKCYLKEALTIITNPKSIISNSSALITVPKIITTNSTALLSIRKSIITNSITLITDSKLIITNSTTFITNPKSILTNSTELITDSKLIITNSNLITNQNSIITNSTILITIPKTIITNSNTLITKPKSIIINKSTFISNPKTIVTNLTTLITSPQIIINNKTTLITNPKTIITNSITFITNPKSIINNSTTLLTYQKSIITNSTNLIFNTKSIISNSNTLITIPKSIIINSSSLISNTKPKITNLITLITNLKSIITSTTALLPNSTIISNPTTIFTNLKSIITNSTSLLTNPKSIITNTTILITNPKTIITNSIILTSNPKVIITNTTSVIANPKTILTNPKTLTTNPTTILLTNQKTILTNPKTLTTNPTLIITNPNSLSTNPKSLITNSSLIITTKLKSQIINTTMNTNIKTTILQNKTDYSESLINKITIILLQVKLKDHQLYLYLLIDSYVSKDFTLKIKINIYIQKSSRNLQQEEKKEMEINISPFNLTNSNSFGGLYTFVPDGTFKEYLLSEGEKTKIVVTNITLNENNNKNEYNIKMVDNSDYLNTAKMEEMIMNNQKVDLSLLKSINIYHLKSVSQGCSFEITTKEIFNVPDRKFNLEFQDIKKYKKIISKCSLYKNNNIIKCNLDEMINSNYTLNDYIDINNNELVSILSYKQNSFQMSCFIRYNNGYQKSKGLSKGEITLIIITLMIAIFISAGLAYFVCKYKTINKNKNKKNSSEIFNYPSSANLQS